MNALVSYPCAKKDRRFTVPSTVKSIYRSAFESCNYLKRVILPDGLETIKLGTFDYCNNLKTVTIPKSVKKIEPAFNAGYNIKVVYYDGTKEQWNKLIKKSDNAELNDATKAYNGAKSAVGINTKLVKTKKGKIRHISGGVFFKNGKVSKDVSYTSTNSKIAKVDNSGEITAKKKGTCYIKVKDNNSSLFSTCKVVVR